MLLEIIAHPHWFWLTLGGLLLAAEMLGTSGYLLWSGIAAVLVGLVEWLAPFSWTAQGTLFALLTLVCVYLWYRWIRHRERHQQPNSLNQRGNQLIGTHLTLDAPLINGIGHVKLGDSSWRVQADQDLPAGTQVIVTGVEGITLHITPR
ncbi:MULTISPECIES: NfeD family protein [Pantoea]|jgi:membrane protein implicated in regulation of membrane protease activity|uniref:NfeD family protein n=1 Tax=Pantoea TaxID=53335 RepID=UPI000EA229A8|nr:MULTISPECIES: NfeD family protein [Pantoea]HCW99407.1 NfeD family protein [Pantoea sp.]MBZ6386340.1 NfeD family protein [Pantoea piersonii]MBZ6400656.1 NfeD family protein [Pantoea piersonii]MBZ6410224.1 NfeD family protein [Pantoea piersonii]MBZ6425863.1 NfeD family protein [Pantoea piersonii]